MIRMRTLLGLVLGTAPVVFAACGDAVPSPCLLSGELSGAVSWPSGASDPICLDPFVTASAGFELDFEQRRISGQHFLVSVPSVGPGQLGAFPAQVQFKLPDGRIWTTTDCTVTIQTNAFVKDEEVNSRYQLAGRGQCASAAMPAGTTGTLTIGPFIFRSPVLFVY